MAADSSTFQHALLLLRTGDMDGAKQWLQIAANGGHLRAMTLLGLYYAEFGDPQSAVRWLTRAADAGEQSAMNFLGALYDGQGDLTAAVQWWGRAAQLGNPAAMYSLGELLISAGYVRDGEGWMRAAADAGHGRALSRLGELVARSSVPEARSSVPEQPAEPATARRDGYGATSGGRRSAAFDREPGHGHRTGYSDRGWPGGHPAQLAELGPAATRLVARSGLPASGLARGAGFGSGPGFLDPGFGALR